MTAITQLEPDVRFPKVAVTRIYYESRKIEDVEYTWDASKIDPVIERLDAATQQIVPHFIAFFEGKIDLPTLKARLAEPTTNEEYKE